MIININQDYRIASDPHQWIVQRRRSVKDREKWDSLGYFGHLDNAVVWLARHRILPMGGVYGPEALEPLCRALDSLRIETKRALEGLPTRPEAWRSGRGFA